MVTHPFLFVNSMWYDRVNWREILDLHEWYINACVLGIHNCSAFRPLSLYTLLFFFVYTTLLRQQCIVCLWPLLTATFMDAILNSVLAVVSTFQGFLMTTIAHTRDNKHQHVWENVPRTTTLPTTATTRHKKNIKHNNNNNTRPAMFPPLFPALPSSSSFYDRRHFIQQLL